MSEDLKSQVNLLNDVSNKLIKLVTNTKKCAKAKITRGYLDTRLETLNGYWFNYTKQYETLIGLYTKEKLKISGLDIEQSYDITEDAYLDLKALIKDYMYEYKNHESKAMEKNETSDSASTLRPKLPPISIPKFSGDYNDWLSFRDLFKSLIHNDNSLSKIEKHHYLKSSLSGEAEQLLKNVLLTDANYDDAWRKLEERFDNKRVIVNNILNRLMNQKKMMFESTKGIKDILDTTSQCISSLNNLNIDTSSWDAIIVHIVVSKLDMDSHKLWEQSLGKTTNIPKYTELASFLENRFRTMEMINFTTNKEVTRREVHKNSHIVTQKLSQNTMKTFATEISTTCTYCSQNHYICHCKEFASLTVPERQDFIKKNNICFNCLVKGHQVSNCRQSSYCKKCGRRHHTLLHATTLHRNVITSNQVPSTSETPSSCNFNDNYSVSQNEQVILATAQIAVKGKNGKLYLLRALVDQGSQASFISETAAQLLNLDRTSVIGKITGIANTSVVTTKSKVALEIHCKNETPTQLQVNAFVLGKLTSLLPSREFPQDTWSLTKELDLADPEFHKPGSIDVLLGAEVHAHIILEGIHKHHNLIALNSQFGWLISGKIAQTDVHKHNVIVTHNKIELDQLLRKFWEIEEQVPHKKEPTQLEVACEEHFKTTHTRNNDGRYIVRLPFKEAAPTNLGNTKGIATSRLLQMERRFKRNADFKDDYHKFIKEYESQGHMEKVLENDKNINQTYYLPHHAVLRPTSLSTKLRVVFDGSAAPETGNSLNSELLTGYPLLPDIRDLITRWRQHKFVLIADIQKMYRQIFISEKDVDFQRIIWRETSDLPFEEYRLLTVTYGTSCAPFLASRTLHQLAEDEKIDFPEESEIIKNDIYMDDLLTGTSTETHAAQLQGQLTKLLLRGGFPLHKWASNSDLVLCQIPDKCKDSQSVVNIKIEDKVKTLGITWNSQTDCFELSVNIEFSLKSATKRNVLSAISKPFDPLGWLAPAIITLKIFMQKLWLAGLDWDVELPQHLKIEWNAYIHNFEQAESIQFPRWFNVTNKSQRMELHGFSDASCAAYACVVYSRVFDGDSVKVSLIMAKSKVSPVKQISVPRLELCGAVLLANMLRYLKNILNVEDENVFAWSDSTIVLAWLRKTPSTWTTFVANRTSEILNLTNSDQWHHIDSANNPADIASRGLSPIDLQQSQLWWNGPNFLNDKSITFQNQPFPETKLETKLESKVKLTVNVLFSELNDSGIEYLSKFSSLSKLIRVTAYCLRFINNCKQKTVDKCSYLTANEIKKSLIVCTRLSQSLSFKEEIECLTSKIPINKTSKVYTLNPYLDNDKLLRIGGRLLNADLPNYTKSPIVLSNKCKFSRLLILDAHFKTLHGGNLLTQNYVRQRYWILRAKNLIKAVLRKCIICFKFKATPLAPFMGNLPEFRVKPSRPFLTSGVDFAGPFTLKLFSGRCKKTYKTYISLFICTVTKAIHLELVTDLTSQAFLAAFKRFTARRGHCKDIWSDCGTNFVGASRELNMAFKNSKSQVVSEIAELLSNDCTTWHFIPPGSPHFGGLWESGVKSIKGHLKRVVGQTILTYEEFSTLLAQVEACVNSRPLTLISSSLDDPPLTPGHFLIGEPLVAVPEPPLIDSKLSVLDRWHMIQRMLQCLWQRWQIEYLTTLQHRYKWNVPQPDIKLDSIVLVKDERLPPGKWLLARVIQKHPGPDGITRVVTLKGNGNCFKRPVTKLCPLPLDA